MNKLIEKIQIEVQALSPVVVSSIDELTPFDYIINSGKIYVLKEKALQMIPEDKLTEAQAYLRELGNIKEVLEKIGVSIDEAVSEALYAAKIDTREELLNKRIKTIIRNPITNKPYIPGSTIKGLIRNAILLQKTRENINKIGQEELKKILEALNTKITGWGLRQLKEYIEKVFAYGYENWLVIQSKDKKTGHIKLNIKKQAKREIRNDPFRILIITDSTEIDNENIGVSIATITSTRKRIEIATEYIKPNTKWEHEIIFSQNIAEKQKISKTTIPTNTNELKKTVIKALREFTQEAIELEEKILKELQKTNPRKYTIPLQHLEKIKQQIKTLQPNQAITRIGWATGIIWKTQLWELAKTTNQPTKTYHTLAKTLKISPKIKRIYPETQKTINNQQTGWIKITIK